MRPEPLRAASLVAAALLLAACRPAPAPVAGAAAADVDAAALPRAAYARLAEAGEAVFRLEPDRSRIDVVVRREGPLARLGHDHVVVIDRVEGLAATTGAGARADLRFLLREMAVDPPEARARHGLDSEPSAEDVEGTRRNMLEATLEASTWPAAGIAVRLAAGLDAATEARFEFDLHGRRHALVAPVRIDAGPGATTVHARFDLAQSDFGIEPFSALGGGLRVADALELHATLVFVPSDRRGLAGDGPAATGMHGGRRSE